MSDSSPTNKLKKVMVITKQGKEKPQMTNLEVISASQLVGSVTCMDLPVDSIVTVTLQVVPQTEDINALYERIVRVFEFEGYVAVTKGTSGIVVRKL